MDVLSFFFAWNSCLYAFFLFSIWLPNWPPNVTWLSFLLLVHIKDLYISNIRWKFYSDRLNGSWDILCWIIYPLHSGVLETCLALRYWVFCDCLAAKVLIFCLLVSSADSLCKQFDTLVVLLKDYFEKVDFEENISRLQTLRLITHHAKSLIH